MQRITKIEDHTQLYGTCYHDYVINDSKEHIMAALGIKPKYNPGGYKTYYDWELLLDGKYPFTIYDMSRGHRLKKTDVIEYHLGWHPNMKDIFLLNL